MASFIPTNIGGNALNSGVDITIYTEKILKQTETRLINPLNKNIQRALHNFENIMEDDYLNEKNDTADNLKVKKYAKDDLDVVNRISLIDELKKVNIVNNKKINGNKKLLGDFTDSLNKLNVKISNLYIPQIEQNLRKMYLSIRNKTKPKFWISSTFPYGLGNKQYIEYWYYRNLSDESVALKVNGFPMLLIDKGNYIGLYFNRLASISSETSFTNIFTLIILSRREGKKGRFITGSKGNKVFVYKDNFDNVIYFNDNVSKGTDINDPLYDYPLKLNIIQCDGKYINNIRELGRIQEIIPLNNKTVTLDNLVIGQPKILSNHAMEGYIYECLCYDYLLTHEQLQDILNVFKLHFKFNI